MREPLPVAIIGAGAVGLFLGLALNRLGIPFRVFEQRSEIHPHSRSLGIHPVSLELLDGLNLTEPFLKQGLPIRRGVAYHDREPIGTIRFDKLPEPWNFILVIPQYQTERILEEALNRAAPGSLHRGWKLSRMEEGHAGQKLRFTTPDGQQEIISNRVIGCDGKNSTVRNHAGIPARKKRYPDTYIMGDFPDSDTPEEAAVIYLHRNGLIESFPLPGRRRRWVVKTDRYIEQADGFALTRRILERLEIRLDPKQARMVSSFGTYRQLADTLVQNRVILAGDAAHVVSPIGGQGMNLGWIGAMSLGYALRDEICLEKGPGSLSRYSNKQRLVAKQAARRAEINMVMGRKQRIPALRKILLQTLVNTPLNPLMARIFTMKGLGRWPA
ncbi:MAG: NAD(P)/FAD-dependent oxidoreductase [Balneolaceae bacterium]